MMYMVEVKEHELTGNSIVYVFPIKVDFNDSKRLLDSFLKCRESVKIINDVKSIPLEGDRILIREEG